MAADGNKSKKVMSKKHLSTTPSNAKKVSSKKVLAKKLNVKKLEPSKMSKSNSSISMSSRSSALSQASGKLRSNSSVAMQSKGESKQSSQRQPIVLNLNLSLNFVMPDGSSPQGNIGNGLTLNLNDILNQQQAGASELSSSSRRFGSHSVVRGKLIKNRKSGIQKSKKLRSSKVLN